MISIKKDPTDTYQEEITNVNVVILDYEKYSLSVQNPVEHHLHPLI